MGSTGDRLAEVSWKFRMGSDFAFCRGVFLRGGSAELHALMVELAGGSAGLCSLHLIYCTQVAAAFKEVASRPRKNQGAVVRGPAAAAAAAE